MAYFDESQPYAYRRIMPAADAEGPFYLQFDRLRYIAFQGAPETVQKLWRDYNRGEYEFNISFLDYLKGKGIDARKTPLPEHLCYLLAIGTPQN